MTNCAPVGAVPLKVSVISHVVPAVIAYPPVTAAQGLAAPADGLREVVLPPNVIEALRTFVFAVPVLLRVTVHGWAVPAKHVAVAVTCALDVNDPNRPNTNPAIAIAAMSVIAMRMTVAMTGEMAFLPLTFVICILAGKPPGRLIKNCVSTISV